jgi:hypothetical protein
MLNYRLGQVPHELNVSPKLHDRYLVCEFVFCLSSILLLNLRNL